MEAPLSSRRVLLGLLGSLALTLAFIAFAGMQMVADVQQGSEVMVSRSCKKLCAHVFSGQRLGWGETVPVSLYSSGCWFGGVLG